MRAVKSLKSCNFIGSFCPKHIKIYMKECRKVSLITLKSVANFNVSSGKSESFILMGYSCRKYVRFELKKCRVVKKCEKVLAVSKMTLSYLMNFHTHIIESNFG